MQILSSGEWMSCWSDDIILVTSPGRRGFQTLVGRLTDQYPGNLPIGKLATQMSDVLMADGRVGRRRAHPESPPLAISVSILTEALPVDHASILASASLRGRRALSIDPRHGRTG
jgi:hypothetical protein